MSLSGNHSTSFLPNRNSRAWRVLHRVVTVSYTHLDVYKRQVMYVGDSITHGMNSGTYRWALHKIFADNGISYHAEGVNSGGVTAGTSYGGQVFNNEHSSQASARAWEISGRKTGSRFDGSNISNWLGLSDAKANGAAYQGPTFTGTDTPDTFFVMIGTNDLLSDGDNSTLDSRLDSCLLYTSRCV